MLQIGQRVIIDEEPWYGYSYFSSEHIDTEDWISGVRKHEDGTYAYQLQGEDEDCWWLEGELTPYEKTRMSHIGNRPQYEIDDEVVEDEEPQTVKSITAVLVSRVEVLYELNHEGAYVDECEITLYRKSGDDTSDYTLF